MTIEEKAYEAYKKDWMLWHGINMDNMDESLNKMEKYIEQNGYDGSCYKEFERFLNTTYKVPEYITSLLSPTDKEEYLQDLEKKGGAIEEFNIPGLHYYEVSFGSCASLCFGGFDKPSIEELEEFCKKDIKFFEHPISEVKEISFEKADIEYALFSDAPLRIFIPKPEKVAKEMINGMAHAGYTIEDVQKHMAELQKSVKDIMFKDPEMHKRLKENENKSKGRESSNIL